MGTERLLSDEESARVIVALRRPPDWPKEWRLRRKIPLNPDKYRKKLGIAAGTCTWCRAKITVTARRHYCSAACAAEWAVRASPIAARAAALRAYPHRCALCGAEADKADLDADHIVPVRLGGGCCGVGNLRLLCRPCHRARIPDRWTEEEDQVLLTGREIGQTFHTIASQLGKASKYAARSRYRELTGKGREARRAKREERDATANDSGRTVVRRRDRGPGADEKPGVRVQKDRGSAGPDAGRRSIPVARADRGGTGDAPKRRRERRPPAPPPAPVAAHGYPWRPAELQAIDAALASGATATRIGRDLAGSLNRTPGSIAYEARKRRPVRQPKPPSPPALHPAPLGRRPWTAAESAQLDALIATGATAADIAAHLAPLLRRTPASVRVRVNNLRAQVRPARVRRVWTDADAAEMRRLRGEGLDWQEIADRLGASRASVSSMAQKFGIAKKRGDT